MNSQVQLPEKMTRSEPSLPLTSPIGYLALGIIVIYCIAYLILIHTTNINWDEFNFLSGIYAAQDGRIAPGLNNLHTVLFAWLTALPGHEIQQIIVARITQLGFFAGAMLILYQISRQFVPPLIALLVILLCISYTDLLRHAYSFRFDTLCLFFSLLALYLIQFRHSTLSASLSGIALAVSFLISIKTVFFLLPIMLLTLIHLCGNRLERTPFLPPVLFIISLVSVFLVVYWLRLLMVTEFGEAGDSGAVELIVQPILEAGKKMFLDDGFMPRREYLSRTLFENAGHWLLLGIGSLLAIMETLRGSEHCRKGLTLLALLIPLAVTPFYRNAFPYFYVMVIPLAMVLSGFAIYRLFNIAQKYQPRLSGYVPVSVMAMAILGSTMYLALDHREGIKKQRVVIEAVHEIFPDPVPYIDAYGMISSFPKVGLWMSSWGMDNYHDRRNPVMADVITEHQPRFVLVNHRALASIPTDQPEGEERYRQLLSEDANELRSHFIHHWGPVYVAGKHVPLKTGGAPEPTEIIIGGTYTIEAKHPVILNGQILENGDTIHLTPGELLISSNSAQTLTLRIGHALPVPKRQPKDHWLFDGL